MKKVLFSLSMAIVSTACAYGQAMTVTNSMNASCPIVGMSFYAHDGTYTTVNQLDRTTLNPVFQGTPLFLSSLEDLNRMGLCPKANESGWRNTLGTPVGFVCANGATGVWDDAEIRYNTLTILAPAGTGTTSSSPVLDCMGNVFYIHRYMSGGNYFIDINYTP